jgi:cell division protein FtsB
MNEFAGMNTYLVSFIGSFIGILLSVIAVFLFRLLQQFDTLNVTVQRIDKDLSGGMGLLKAENVVLKAKVDDLNLLWERMRLAENEITMIQATYNFNKEK